MSSYHPAVRFPPRSRLDPYMPFFVIGGCFMALLVALIIKAA